ncbi:hypothetical protein HanIR_Chr02g0059581 [Helianthus annuus]|nr:hypothetical protein HanIR_Chr02g0059581 [Helianthus annuus]
MPSICSSVFTPLSLSLSLTGSIVREGDLGLLQNPLRFELVIKREGAIVKFYLLFN